MNTNPDSGNPVGFARQVTIASAGANTGVTFTVTGTDAAGEVLTEKITGPGAGASVTGTSKFLTIEITEK